MKYMKKWHSRVGIGLLSALAFLMLVGCGDNSNTGLIPPFVGPIWEWTGTTYTAGSSLAVPNPTSYTIQFQADNNYTGQADCNNIRGSFTTRGDSLSLNPGITTRAACPPGSLDEQFTSQLANVSSFVTNPGVLTLTLQRNAGTMQFRTTSPMPTSSSSPVPVTVIPTAVPPVQPTTVPTAVPPTGVPLTACPGLPQIEFFRAEPATIVQGQNSVLRWGLVSNANTVVIDQGIGGVGTPGSTVVTPAQTTTYILTAVGCGGQSQASVTVVVQAPTAPPPTNVPPTQPPPTAQPTAVPPTTEPGADLLGLWRWTGTRLQDGSVVTPANMNNYTISFQPGGNAAIVADCNQGTGTWSVSGNQLSIIVGGVTSAFCGEESESERYLQWLGQASTYSVQGPNLTIVLAQDSGQMTFTR